MNDKKMFRVLLAIACFVFFIVLIVGAVTVNERAQQYLDKTCADIIGYGTWHGYEYGSGFNPKYTCTNKINGTIIHIG